MKPDTFRKTLLVCGIASSLLYLAMNMITASQFPGYSSVNQTVSELSAIGAPTRPLWVALGTIYSMLFALFGLGVWLSANGPRMRVAGAVVVAYAVFGAFWPPMHARDVIAAGGGTLTDTLHIAWTFVELTLMLVVMGFAAAASGRRFRLFTVATVIVHVTFGLLTGLQAPGVSTNQPTPWIGVWERINIAAFMFWAAVLAAALIRRVEPATVVSHDGSRLAA